MICCASTASFAQINALEQPAVLRAIAKEGVRKVTVFEQHFRVPANNFVDTSSYPVTIVKVEHAPEHTSFYVYGTVQYAGTTKTKTEYDNKLTFDIKGRRIEYHANGQFTDTWSYDENDKIITQGHYTYHNGGPVYDFDSLVLDTTFLADITVFQSQFRHVEQYRNINNRKVETTAARAIDSVHRIIYTINRYKGDTVSYTVYPDFSKPLQIWKRYKYSSGVDPLHNSNDRLQSCYIDSLIYDPNGKAIGFFRTRLAPKPIISNQQDSFFRYYEISSPSEEKQYSLEENGDTAYFTKRFDAEHRITAEYRKRERDINDAIRYEYSTTGLPILIDKRGSNYHYIQKFVYE